ncbi:MAG TPA: hypothetical protein VHS31_16465 [Tepidisphaeraceae bacterium]|jgi:hypothetical protein|nr:hypothetical protein [Tepidisphaeraceae bacterium]
MQNRFGATVLVWSLASFAVTAAFFLPGALQATAPTSIQPPIDQPTTISTDRIDLSLKLAGQTDDATTPIPIEPGATPSFKLEAKNKTTAALTVPIKIAMESTARPSGLSRTPPRTKEIWTYQRDLVLAPGQADSIDISSDTKLTAGSTVFVKMDAGDKTVYPLGLVVKPSDAK